MANFSAEIRRDLLAHLPKTRAGAAAALAGLLATGASLTEDGFEIVSENERVAAYFLRLAEFFGARPEVREAMRDPKRKRDKLVIFCGGEEAARIFGRDALSARTPCRGRGRGAVLSAGGVYRRGELYASARRCVDGVPF